MKQFLLYSFRLVLIVSLSLASVYEEGDTVSNEHQNVVFTQCYGYDEDGEIKLADYLGKVLWIDLSASWCAPCWDAICEIDELTLQWINEPNVENFISLSDLGMPYSCTQWGDEDITGIPIIVDGGAGVSGGDILFNWFNTDAYPSYVFIDHTMTVRHMINNADFSVELANQWIGEMLNNLDVKETQVNLPDIFYLHENYPNPFNASTTIEYDLKENRDIKLSVFDLSGREVDVIRENYQIIGTHTVAWETSDVPSGVYFFRLSSGKFVQTRKAVLLK
mgnify:CR=1 FL=1